MKRTIAAIALVALVALAGCSGTAAEGNSTSTPTTTATPASSASDATVVVAEGENDKMPHTGVVRFIDEEAGVVCYVVEGDGAPASGAGWQSGISCVPLNETNLEGY